MSFLLINSGFSDWHPLEFEKIFFEYTNIFPFFSICIKEGLIHSVAPNSPDSDFILPDFLKKVKRWIFPKGCPEKKFSYKTVFLY